MSSEDPLNRDAPMARLRRSAAAKAREAMKFAEAANHARRTARAMLSDADDWEVLAEHLGAAPIETLTVSTATHAALKQNSIQTIGTLISIWGRLPLAHLKQMPKMTHSRYQRIELALFDLFRKEIGRNPQSWHQDSPFPPYGQIHVYKLGETEDWIDP